MRRAYKIIVSIGLLILASFAVTTAEFADNLYIDVDFVPNIMFSTYDVNLTLDGQLIETLSHGDDYTKLLNDIADGEHEIIFFK